jgi:hypothetical protein
MATVKMAQRAITVSRENRNRRVLMSFAIFAAEIVLKSAVAGARNPESSHPLEVAAAVRGISTIRLQRQAAADREISRKNFQSVPMPGR